METLVYAYPIYNCYSDYLYKMLYELPHTTINTSLGERTIHQTITFYQFLQKPQDLKNKRKRYTTTWMYPGQTATIQIRSLDEVGNTVWSQVSVSQEEATKPTFCLHRHLQVTQESRKINIQQLALQYSPTNTFYIGKV